MFGYIPEVPTSANHASAKYPIGNVYHDYDADEGLRIWMYVQNDGLIDTTDGACAELTENRGIVTTDRNSPADVHAGMAAGFFRSIVTTQYYGFIQVSGYIDGVVQHDGSLAPGEWGVPHTNDEVLDTMAAGEEHQVCFRCTDTGETYASGYIVNCM